MPLVVAFSRAELEQGMATPVTSVDNARKLVSCGPVPDAMIFVDLETATKRESGQLGEICVTGPSVALGYWKNPEATGHTFNARVASAPATPFLRTGDVGFEH